MILRLPGMLDWFVICLCGLPFPSFQVNTQQSFEALNKRAVAVVVDPIQSVKGKVVIDAFRTINPQLMMLGHAPRQTTSNLGHLRKPSVQALIHNLNRHYYSINISYRKNELEQKMLLNLHKKNWTNGLTIKSAVAHANSNEETLKTMLDLAKQYNKRLEEAEGKTTEELLVMNVGKIDPKKHLESNVEELMTTNISQTLGLMLDTVIF
jgi:26S proteasome regulatory subunit N11